MELGWYGMSMKSKHISEPPDQEHLSTTANRYSVNLSVEPDGLCHCNTPHYPVLLNGECTNCRRLRIERYR